MAEVRALLGDYLASLLEGRHEMDNVLRLVDHAYEKGRTDESREAMRVLGYKEPTR